MKRSLITLIVIALFCNAGFSQKTDKTKFKEYEPGYYQNFILKDVRQVNEQLKAKEVDKKFMMDHEGYDFPNKISLYKKAWSQPTISQGNAGTCWSYSTTFFYESEVKRIHGKEVDISEIFTVYYEYIEKARRFIKERGNSHFSQGSEGNAVARMFKMYGACPYSAYTGLINGRTFQSLPMF